MLTAAVFFSFGVLAHKLLAFFNQLVKLGTEVCCIVVHADVIAARHQRTPVHIEEIAVACVRVCILVLIAALAGNQGNGNSNTGKGAHVDIGVELIIIDVWNDPCPFPDGAAADIYGEQNLLLEHGFHRNGKLAAVCNLNLPFKFQLQLCAQAITVFKVFQNIFTCFDRGRDVLRLDTVLIGSHPS